MVWEGSLETLAMMDDSNNVNPWDEVDERFSKIEEQLSKISCNMIFLMEALKNKFGPFKEVGGSNSKARSMETKW